MNSAIAEKTRANVKNLDANELLYILTEVKKGNLSVRMPLDKEGITGKIYETLNAIIELNETMLDEFNKAGQTIGKKGRLDKRLEVPNAKGSWEDGVNSYRKSGYVVLSVADNGLGIKDEHQSKMFGMFRRFHNHLEGSGIGLYIVKRIVENHGGFIEIESIRGTGSTFKVYFKTKRIDN